jgi:hypothetical protein
LRTLFGVADYFLVERRRGPAWNRSRGSREQKGWDAHAVFMDALADEGFIVLGGPVGEGNGDYFLFVVDARDEEEIRERFAHDPWPEDVLRIASIQPWSVWLRAPA